MTPSGLGAGGERSRWSTRRCGSESRTVVRDALKLEREEKGTCGRMCRHSPTHHPLLTRKGGKAPAAAQPDGTGAQKAGGVRGLARAERTMLNPAETRREVQAVGCPPGWSARSRRSRSKRSPGSHHRAGLGVARCVREPLWLLAAPRTPGTGHGSFPLPEPCVGEQGKNSPTQVFGTCRLVLG